MFKKSPRKHKDKKVEERGGQNKSICVASISSRISMSASPTTETKQFFDASHLRITGAAPDTENSPGFYSSWLLFMTYNKFPLFVGSY